MDTWTLILVLITFVFVSLWRWENSPYVRQIDRIPGPPKIPFFGSIYYLPRDGPGLLQAIHIKWAKAYGHAYRFWRGFFAVVNVSSARDVETILSSQKLISKDVTYNFLRPWLGDGLLLSAGNKWRRDRKLLTPAFHFQILDGFFDVFNRNANILVEQINKRLPEQKEIDIIPLVSRCTLDVICEAAMGIQIDAQLNSDSEYITAIDKTEIMITERINSIHILLPDWLYYYFTPHGCRFLSYVSVIHGFTGKVVRTRKAQFNEEVEKNDSKTQAGIKKRRAFLDLLLQATREGADLSETDIINQVDTFMFEGHDTTSSAITWFLYCMATHPEIQDLVYQEIQDCFGDSDRPCTLEDLPSLKYFDCCVKESLRRHPPVPFIRRQITEETVLSGYKVPVGASVGVQIYALHHNEEYFPDPDSFKPERFQMEQTIGRNPFAFVPFSAGPRNCIGQKFAMYEDKVILTTLLRKFRFDIDSSRMPVKESLNMVLKPESGIILLIKPRY